MLDDGEEHPCAYTPITQALREGSVVIRETGRVQSLRIENTGGQPVFAPAGTYLRGGGQDRMLAVSVVLNERSTGEIPTRCVEKRRWNPSGQGFTAPEHGTIVESSIVYGSTQTPQRHVWETVDNLKGTTRTTSGTLRLGDVYEQSRDAMKDYQALTIDDRGGRLIGAFFAVYGMGNLCHRVVLDLFGRQDLFREFFPGLRDSAALTALATLSRQAGQTIMGQMREPSDTDALQEYRRSLEALQKTPLAEEPLPGNRGTLRTSGAGAMRVGVLEDAGYPLHILLRHSPSPT